MSAYRVVANETLKHLQWIIVRDEAPGRPIMVGGPFVDERIAIMHCDAMNQGHIKSRRRRFAARIARCWSLVKAGRASFVFYAARSP